MGYRDRPRLTPESFQALYGGRHRAAVTEAIRGHLVDGLSLAQACKRAKASRSGVYKAMEKTGGLTPVQSAFLVHCPVHRMDTLRGLIDRQLSIWAKADADALEAHTASINEGVVDADAGKLTPLETVKAKHQSVADAVALLASTNTEAQA